MHNTVHLQKYRPYPWYNTVTKVCPGMYFAEVQKCLKFVMLSVAEASL